MSASDTGLSSSATVLVWGRAPSPVQAERSSAAAWFEVKPMVATLDVYTTRRTPCFRAASSKERVPSTFERYISPGSRTHSRYSAEREIQHRNRKAPSKSTLRRAGRRQRDHPSGRQCCEGRW